MTKASPRSRMWLAERGRIRLSHKEAVVLFDLLDPRKSLIRVDIGVVEPNGHSGEATTVLAADINNLVGIRTLGSNCDHLRQFVAEKEHLIHHELPISSDGFHRTDVELDIAVAHAVLIDRLRVASEPLFVDLLELEDARRRICLVIVGLHELRPVTP